MTLSTSNPHVACGLCVYSDRLHVTTGLGVSVVVTLTFAKSHPLLLLKESERDPPEQSGGLSRGYLSGGAGLMVLVPVLLWVANVPWQRVAVSAAVSAAILLAKRRKPPASNVPAAERPSQVRFISGPLLDSIWTQSGLNLDSIRLPFCCPFRRLFGLLLHSFRSNLGIGGGAACGLQ